MNELETALQEVKIGKASFVRNFSVFPLLAERARDPQYAVLADAIRTGSAVLKETSEGGTVPRLTLANNGDQPLLLVDGEQLIGCKQNRILNLTILAPARSDIVIPVSCVEQGRWRYDSAQFRDSGQSLYAGLRAKKTTQVSLSLANRGAPFAAQEEIWADLAMKADRLGSKSSTGSMSGIFEHRETEVRKYLKAIHWEPAQVGALFAINGRFVGVELFDSDSTCSKYLEKIASGFALDAIDYFTPIYPVATDDEARRFLEHVGAARQARFDAIGLGQDVRLDGQNCTGAALVLQGKVVHFCGFDLSVHTEPGFGDGNEEHLNLPPILRPSTRRRGWSRRYE